MRSHAAGSRPSPPPPALAVDCDDSWEVRAFAEDTSGAMGTTWPPRFYHCTFCRREFRSAQALGGHMNVHRRDRARMQIPPNQPPPSPAPKTVPAASLAAPSTSFFPLSGCKNSRTINYFAPSSDSFYQDSSCLLKLGSSRTSSKEEDDQLPACHEEPDLELRLGW